MPTKTVNLVGETIEASTIAEFYDRLNTLRHLNDGTSNVSFTAPAIGTRVRPSDVNNVETEITATKSALTFLASVNISTHTPNASTNAVATAVSSVHPLEWQIGQLEKACVTNFTTNRVGNNASNYGQNTANGTATFSSGACSTNKTANHGADGTLVDTCSGNWGSVRITNYTPQNTPNHSHNSTFRSGFFSTYRQYVNTSFHGGHGCNTWGSNYSPKQKTFHKTFNGTQRASDGTSFAANFGTHFSGKNSSHRNSANTPFFQTQSSGTSNSANFTAFNATNFALHNATNCPSYSSACAVDWTSFTVSPL